MIRRVCICVAFLLLFAVRIQGRQRALGFCQQGGQVVTVAGLVGAPGVQASFPNCTVTVFFSGEAGAISISSISRASNVVTLVVSGTNPIANVTVNASVVVAGVLDTTYNGTFTLSTVNPGTNTVTYSQTGANSSSSGGTATFSPLLFVNNSGGALSNPFTAANSGLWFFYADNSRYDVQLSGGGFPSAFTLGDVLLLDVGIGIQLNVANTWTALQTFNAGLTCLAPCTLALPVTLTGNGFSNSLTGTVTAARTWTLQDASDTFVFRTTTDTLTNKTFDISLNTLKTATNTAGHYPRNNGTQYIDATIPAGDIPAGTACGANNFVTGLSAGLAVTCAQPSFANLSGTISSSQQNSATSIALGAIELANDLSGTATAPTVVAWHFGLTQRTLSSTAPTTGQVLKFDGSNIVGSTLTAYTNWGTNSSCTQTGASAGATQTCTITLNTTEADANYKVVCGGTGTITGYPFMQGVTSKTTTNLVVQYTNGTANEAVASGWGTIECILTR